jgi:hypothetical protein
VKGEDREENNESNDEAGDNAPPRYPGSQPPTPGPEAEFDAEAGESRFLPHTPIPSLSEDEPIPVDNRSEWVRAERALGS